MPHPLVLALFDSRDQATAAVRALRSVGIPDEQLSIVARTHDEEVALAHEAGGTPGVEIEDSRPAALLGELGGQMLAALALVMPGVGPIVAAGPLSAELGEAAGHAAGGVSAILSRAGVSETLASAWQDRVKAGAVLVGIHATTVPPEEIEEILKRSGAQGLERAEWR
jgi:hypothetical protein